MLAGIVLSAFNLRTAVTSITPLLDVVGREFGFGATMAGFIGMLPAAAFAAFGAATPAIVHRLGLERTVLAAMALAAVGLVLRSLAGGMDLLVAGSLVSLAGMGIGNVVLPPLVKRWFPHRIGMLSVVYITALQAGTIMAALLAVPLANAFGWRLSMGAWALTAVAAMLPWLALLRRGAVAAAAVATTDLDSTPASRNRVWHTPLGWGMALMFGMTSLATYAMFTWMPRIFTDAGAEWRGAGCSMCLGMNPDQLTPGERSASTSNRNFEGRQGKGGRTHLVSPDVAVATAVLGHLASPADLEPVPATAGA